MSWHISVAIFRAEDGSLKHRTYTHLFGIVKQDWFAVASALEHTLMTIKVQMPHITEVFLRSDNAKCYHCGCLWLSVNEISERTGVRIARYDYSEAQSGKSIYDAKIAHMQSKMLMFVSSGNNIKTPFEMKEAIMGGSGVTGCHCAVVEVDSSKQTMNSHRIKGISNINNLDFDEENIIVWQAYDVSIGIRIKRSSDLKTEQQNTDLKILSDFKEPHHTVRMVTRNDRRTNAAAREELITEIFYCSELGCTMQFSSLVIFKKTLILVAIQEKKCQPMIRLNIDG